MQAGGRGFEPHPLHRSRAGRITWPAILLLLMVTVASGFGVSWWDTRRDQTAGYLAHVQDDITRLRAAQARFFADSGRFASLDELTDFVPSQGVVMQVTASGASAWSGRAWHLRVAIDCEFDQEGSTCA